MATVENKEMMRIPCSCRVRMGMGFCLYGYGVLCVSILGFVCMGMGFVCMGMGFCPVLCDLHLVEEQKGGVLLTAFLLVCLCLDMSLFK